MSGDRLDSLGIWEATAGLPEQVAEAAHNVAELDGHVNGDGILNVVVLGMGGSGIVGDVLASVAGPFTELPIVTVKNYAAPGCVSPSTLVFAVSYSGNTEETVEAADMAYEAGGQLVVLSVGGLLAQRAKEWGAVHVPLPDVVMPRAAVGAMAVPPLMILEQLGFFPGAHEWVAQAVDQLRRRRDLLLGEASPARRIAARIGSTIPVVYGAGGVGMVAAARWKNQVNENAKAPAFATAMPEACHNELEGWSQSPDVTRTIFTNVQLRHEFEHPQISRRFSLIDEVMEKSTSGIVEVVAEGEGPVAQLFDLFLIGDFVSLELAALAGVDPGPIPVLDGLKAKLAGPGA